MYVCEDGYQNDPYREYYIDETTKIPAESILGSMSSEQIGTNTIISSNISDGVILPEKVTFINKTKTENLYNKNSDEIQNGYFKPNGSFVKGGQYYTSGLIEVKPATQYTFVTTEGEGSTWAKCYWDSNKKSLNVNNWNSIFTTPEECYYVTVTTNLKGIDHAVLLEGNHDNVPFIPYYKYELSKDIVIPNTGSKLAGKKWNAMGDSITNGYGYKPYHSWIAEDCGVTVRNYGISGNRLSTDGGPYGIPMCIRYNDMCDDADIITVMGGTNDQAHGVPLGVFTDRNVDTFYGALHVLIQGLIRKYPGKTIAFFTPIQRAGCKNNSGFVANGLVAYVDAVIEVCAYYSIPCLDLFRHGGIQHDVSDVQKVYITDGTHPTDIGHRDILAGKIRGFLEGLL